MLIHIPCTEVMAHGNYESFVCLPVPHTSPPLGHGGLCLHWCHASILIKKKVTVSSNCQFHNLSHSNNKPQTYSRSFTTRFVTQLPSKSPRSPWGRCVSPPRPAPPAPSARTCPVGWICRCRTCVRKNVCRVCWRWKQMDVWCQTCHLSLKC